jgi:LmbE family N-acetylglucosaminyl deacetylase
VDIESVLETKSRMLACHRSQNDWLEASQGMNAYRQEMVEMSAAMAARGASFRRAEGWKRHAHLGFCPPDFDPLEDLLGPFIETTTIKA